MHEMSLAMNIIDLTSARARQEGSEKILAVELEVGTMAGVMVESLEFCFEAASKNTLAAGAQLTIHSVEAQGQCPMCKAHFAVQSMTDGCPECGEMMIHISGGRDLKVRSITLD